MNIKKYLNFTTPWGSPIKKKWFPLFYTWNFAPWPLNIKGLSCVYIRSSWIQKTPISFHTLWFWHRSSPKWIGMNKTKPPHYEWSHNMSLSTGLFPLCWKWLCQLCMSTPAINTSIAKYSKCPTGTTETPHSQQKPSQIFSSFKFSD